MERVDNLYKFTAGKQQNKDLNLDIVAPEFMPRSHYILCLCL